jgi:hypothetical protein
LYYVVGYHDFRLGFFLCVCIYINIFADSTARSKTVSVYNPPMNVFLLRMLKFNT